MGEVVAYSTAALHQLHLFLVYLHDAAVGVGLMLVADDEAVGLIGLGYCCSILANSFARRQCIWSGEVSYRLPKESFMAYLLIQTEAASSSPWKYSLLSRSASS